MLFCSTILFISSMLSRCSIKEYVSAMASLISFVQQIIRPRCFLCSGLSHTRTILPICPLCFSARPAVIIVPESYDTHAPAVGIIRMDDLMQHMNTIDRTRLQELFKLAWGQHEGRWKSPNGVTTQESIRCDLPRLVRIYPLRLLQ